LKGLTKSLHQAQPGPDLIQSPHVFTEAFKHCSSR